MSIKTKAEHEVVSNQPVVYACLPKTYVDDEIDLRELWFIVWDGKWIITSITTLFAVAAMVIALCLPDMYRSQTLLAPSNDAQVGSMAGAASQLGGLASLAGINLSAAGGHNKVQLAIEVLKSRRFITRFIEKYELLPELMAVDSWNSATGKLVFNEEIYLAAEKKWVRDVDLPKTSKPSAWEAYKEFKEVLRVSQDKETGFVTLTIEHQSPIVAKRWVTLLVDEINSVIKKKDTSEARRSIDYLQKKLSEVGVAEMRSVFYQLIEEQTKTIMLAEVREEYVFSTIDPPVSPEESFEPKRILICVLGVMMGGAVALAIVFLRHFVRADTRSG